MKSEVVCFMFLHWFTTGRYIYCLFVLEALVLLALETVSVCISGEGNSPDQHPDHC